MKKRIGILAPIFTLPNEFGIGDFSYTAYQFIDFLSLIGYRCWQILPLNPIDRDHSPYLPVSSFAIDDIYVSIPDLYDRGLVKKIIPYTSKRNFKRVNYRKVRKFKNAYLEVAYQRFKEKEGYINILEAFKIKEPWVNEYASYVVLRKNNKTEDWSTWTVKATGPRDIDAVNYEIFKQYILYEEWDKIHQYAKKKNIAIIGDLPFYVGYDSMECFYNKECFILNQDHSPALVAGCPPDYFSEDGQRWGNPIYNWEYLKTVNYDLLFKRILHASEIYDVVRLDHFRAFDTYYTIEAHLPNARIGEWKEAPGYDFFDKLYQKKPDLKLIAEDLGDLREEVFTLRDHYELPGMQVVEFSFIEEEIQHHEVPHIYKRENSVIYLSTHDNMTGMEWFDSLTPEEQQAIRDYMDEHFGHHHIMTSFFKYLASQPASLVILSLWDILRLGKSGRINSPGTTSKNNWTFRLRNYVNLYSQGKKLKDIAIKSGRNE
ncbi:MAG: 4-alpha-glucanotransferase [Bacilli bacterium]|nr:4-alpha-glucanotransferase [Bacilli bacterium]